MRMRLFIYAQVFLFFLAGGRILAATGSPPRIPRMAEAPGVTFRDFNSVVNMALPETVKKLRFGWARNGFSWGSIEPQKGQWKWRGTDELVLGAQADGVVILPILAYTAPWAESIKGNPGSPPAHLEDWESFVEHVVARYSRPPFNLRYFQVWNEPTRQAGFWTGSDQEFVDKVYLPAAKTIRRHGCFVVFGGWPASNSLQEFDNVLEYHNAWRWTDILDIHYEGLPDWEYLYDRWVKSGKCRGIWETELGFTDDPDFVPSVYLPMLYWALKNGWNDPNQYKLFWYASWGAGKDGPNCLSMPGRDGQTVLTVPGTELAVLNEVFGAGALATFSRYTVAFRNNQEHSPSRSSVIGFRSGRRIVIGMLINRQSLRNSHSLSVRVSMMQKPKTAEIVTEDGSHLQLKTHFHAGSLKVKIPLQRLVNVNGKLLVGYLTIDPS